MNTYPQYYRAGCKCIKRISDTEGSQVEIPDACKVNTIQYISLFMFDKKSFDHMVTKMDRVAEEVFLKYVSIFNQIKRKQTSVYQQVARDHSKALEQDNAFRKKKQLNYF